MPVSEDMEDSEAYQVLDGTEGHSMAVTVLVGPSWQDWV